MASSGMELRRGNAKGEKGVEKEGGREGGGVREMVSEGDGVMLFGTVVYRRKKALNLNR